MSGIADRLPATATNKVVKRELAARGANPSGGRQGPGSCAAGCTPPEPRNSPRHRRVWAGDGQPGILDRHRTTSGTGSRPPARTVLRATRRPTNEEDTMKSGIHPAYGETTGLWLWFHQRHPRRPGRVACFGALRKRKTANESADNCCPTDARSVAVFERDGRRFPVFGAAASGNTEKGR